MKFVHLFLIGFLFSCSNKKEAKEINKPEVPEEQCQITINQTVVVDTTVCPVTLMASDKGSGRFLYNVEVFLEYNDDTVKLVTDSAGYAGGYYNYNINSIKVVKSGYGEAVLKKPEIEQKLNHCLEINIALTGTLQ